MKKPTILFLAFIFLTTCVTACGAPGASGGAASTPVSAAVSAPEAAPAPAPAQEGLRELSRFDGAGVYLPSNLQDGTPYLSYIDSATATQKTICTRSNCTHADADCPAVSSAKNNTLLGCYRGKLLYRDFTSETIFVNGEATSMTLATSDTNGENYRVVATIPNTLAESWEFLYNGAALLCTRTDSGWLFNSVDLESGEVTQITPAPLSGLDNYLGAYEDHLYFKNIRDGEQCYEYSIISVHAATGEKATLYTARQQVDPQVFTTTNYSFGYHNGKIYQLSTVTLKGTDILTEIDCITGAATVVDDAIPCNSPHGQKIACFVKDKLLIETIANASDLPFPQPKRFFYDLTDHTLTPGALTIPHPGNDFISPIFIVETLGDNLLVHYTVSGVPQAIMSTADFLASVPSYRDVVVVNP